MGCGSLAPVAGNMLRNLSHALLLNICKNIKALGCRQYWWYVLAALKNSVNCGRSGWVQYVPPLEFWFHPNPRAQSWKKWFLSETRRKSFQIFLMFWFNIRLTFIWKYFEPHLSIFAGNFQNCQFFVPIFSPTKVGNPFSHPTTAALYFIIRQHQQQQTDKTIAIIILE